VTESKSAVFLSYASEDAEATRRICEALAAYRSTNAVVESIGTAMAEHTLGHAAESQRALDALIKDHGRSLAYQIAQIYARRSTLQGLVE
jgi:hypothetical protein